MMKSKEEVIREAWGEWWTAVKEYVDENGWFFKDNFDKIDLTYEDISATVDFIHDHSTDEMIPKEIHGIRENNGWTKIESENDLPKEGCEYWVVLKSRTVAKASYLSDRKVFFMFGDIEVTHYKKFEYPKPPIY